MNQICLKCNLAYITKKQGVTIEETADFGSYKLWEADLKECPKCKHQIVSGFANKSFVEHYQEGYKEALKKMKEVGNVYQWNEKYGLNVK